MNDWESWVGRTTRQEAYLDAAQANRMAVTLDRQPEFTAGDSLPPAWHWLYFHDLVPASQLGRDGHPALGVTMPPIPLERRMWAGGSLEFIAPIPLGSHAERVSRIASITPKEGRTGKLCFVSVEHELVVDGHATLRETQTIVYRELVPGGQAPQPQSATADAQYSDLWEMNNTSLFRYSALTFNGHRIHYDVDYARDVEGYENLVIHGPLIATLMLDAASKRGHDIETFTYRAKSPLLLPNAFTVNGRIEGDSGTLWAAATDGRLAMDAEVVLRGQD